MTKTFIPRPGTTPAGKLLAGNCLALLLLFSGACTTVADKTAADTAAEAAAEPAPEARIVSIEPVRPKIELSQEILYQMLLAEFAGQRGHLDVAVENYRQLALRTRDPKIVERATQIAVYARNVDAARQTAELWVELDPHNSDAHQVLAVMALRGGDAEQTINHLQQILDYSHGELNQKLWMIANMLGREQDKQLVITVMERLLEGRQDDPQASFAFANIAARMGEIDRALELLEHAMSLDPDNDNMAMSYVSLLQRQERVNDAIQWLEQTLPLRDTNDFNLRLSYARLLTEVQRYDNARRQFEILSASAPNNADVLYALGLLYLQDNRLDESEIYFKRLAERSERFDNAKYYLGRIAEERKDYDTANTWYVAVTDGENYFEAQLRVGYLKARTGDIDGALLHLEGIRTGSGEEEISLVQARGEILTEEKRYQEAMAVYDQALEGKFNSTLLYSRAMAAEKLNRIDLLERDLRAVLEQEPDNADALNALGYTLADRTDRYQEAYELIARALELRPGSFFILDSMGWVLYRMGRHEEALQYLQQAIEERNDAEVAAHLFEVLWVMGKQEEANKIWEMARQSNPDNDLLLDVKERFSPAPR